MKPHKNAELIKALADGAKLEFRHRDKEKCNGVRFAVKNQKITIFDSEDLLFRVKPNCEYALNKIRELGGDETVELYAQWLEGESMQFEHSTGNWYTMMRATNIKRHCLFSYFLECLKNTNSTLQRYTDRLRQSAEGEE